jgi:hypothetical protein
LAVAFDASHLYRESAQKQVHGTAQLILNSCTPVLLICYLKGGRSLSERVVSEIEYLREEAWIGDAVLALFVRGWLLTAPNRTTSVAQRAALFELFVSNQFLSTFGEPTRVEAEIGRLYQSDGLPAAFAFIEAKFLKRFLKTARKKRILG